MLQMLLLMAFGKAADYFAKDKPSWLWAAAYGILSVLLFARFNAAAAVFFVVSFLHGWAYFALLRRFHENLVYWLMIYILGALLPFLLLMFTAHAA